MSSQLSAIELLKLGDEGRTRPFLNQIWPQFLGVAFGIGTGVALNFGTKRPLFSGNHYIIITIYLCKYLLQISLSIILRIVFFIQGIQKHILFVAGWTAALTYVQTKRDDYLAEKDAVYRHYVELHPEDFPVSGKI